MYPETKDELCFIIPQTKIIKNGVTWWITKPTNCHQFQAAKFPLHYGKFSIKNTKVALMQKVEVKCHQNLSLAGDTITHIPNKVRQFLIGSFSVTAQTCTDTHMDGCCKKTTPCFEALLAHRVTSLPFYTNVFAIIMQTIYRICKSCINHISQ